MDDLNRVSDAILERKILYPGKTSIRDYGTSAKIKFHFQTLYKDKSDNEITLDDSRKLDKPMELILGKQFRLQIWEELIKSMCVKEVSRFVIDKQLVINYPYISAQYRKYANYPIECKIKSNSSCCARMIEQGVGYDDLNELMQHPTDLVFVIEILNAESDYQKEYWQMNDEERKHELASLKKSGNEFYKQSSLVEAEKCYLKALSILANLQIKHAPKTAEYKELQIIEMQLNSNMAQLLFKQANYYESISYCDKVLKLDNQNVKMLFRKAQSNAQIWNAKEAEQDYEQVKRLDSKMTNVINKELDELRTKMRKIEAEEKVRLVI